MTKPTLIIMAKTPRVGVGKQRLAAEVGRVEAWRVARLLHAKTLHAVRDPRWRTLLCVTPDRDARGEALAQGRGDLGARLARALAPYRNVAVIGTDCPLISRALVWRAFRALRDAPFALGPTDDGGFWLLAARSGREAATAMRNVRWSSAHAAADVTRNLDARVAQLPTLWDVDTADDLKRWRAYGAAVTDAMR